MISKERLEKAYYASKAFSFAVECVKNRTFDGHNLTWEESLKTPRVQDEIYIPGCMCMDTINELIGEMRS